MYLYPVTTKDSEIEGKGVFAVSPIKEGSVVWKFDANHDITLSTEDFERLSESEKSDLEKVGYISPLSGTWVYPPEGDPARFTNHDTSRNNLSVVFDESISPEPVFIANRNISEGEELLVNYSEFDEFIRNNKPSWL